MSTFLAMARLPGKRSGADFGLGDLERERERGER